MLSSVENEIVFITSRPTLSPLLISWFVIVYRTDFTVH